MNKITAYSYLRFSSSEQSSGDSYRRQSSLIESFVSKHNLDLQSERFEDLGVSGYTGDNFTHGALGRFISMVNNGDIKEGSWLILESWDRFSRMGHQDSLLKALELLKKKIVIAILEPEQIFDSSNTESFTVNTIRSLVELERGNKESHMKSMRLKAVWKAKKDAALETGKPMTSLCPAWIELKDGTFQLIPEKAEVIRTIFDLSIAGYGRRAISVYLNQHSIKPLSSKARTWHTSYIEKILSNPATYGVLVSYKLNSVDKSRKKDCEIPDYYPAVITREQFILSVKKSKDRTVQRGVSRLGVVNNLFSGLLRCSCGDKLTKKDRRRGCIYYECYSHLEQRGCTRPRIYASVLEDILINAVTYLGAESFFGTDSEDKKREIQQTLELELAKRDDLNDRITNLLGVISRRPSPATENMLAELEDQYNECVFAIEKLEDGLSEQNNAVLTDSEEYIQLVKQLALLSYSEDHDARARFAHWLTQRVTSVVVNDDEIIIKRVFGNEVHIKLLSSDNDCCVWEINDSKIITIPSKLFAPRRRTSLEVIESGRKAYNELLDNNVKPTRSEVSRISGLDRTTVIKRWNEIIADV